MDPEMREAERLAQLGDAAAQARLERMLWRRDPLAKFEVILDYCRRRPASLTDASAGMELEVRGRVRGPVDGRVPFVDLLLRADVDSLMQPVHTWTDVRSGHVLALNVPLHINWAGPTPSMFVAMLQARCEPRPEPKGSWRPLVLRGDMNLVNTGDVLRVTSGPFDTLGLEGRSQRYCYVARVQHEVETVRAPGGSEVVRSGRPRWSGWSAPRREWLQVTGLSSVWVAAPTTPQTVELWVPEGKAS